MGARPVTDFILLNAYSFEPLRNVINLMTQRKKRNANKLDVANECTVK